MDKLTELCKAIKEELEKAGYDTSGALSHAMTSAGVKTHQTEALNPHSAWSTYHYKPGEHQKIKAQIDSHVVPSLKAKFPNHEVFHEHDYDKGIGKVHIAPKSSTIKKSELEKSAFKKLQHKIEHEGHSAESAAAITASIGRKKLGEAEMERRSKEARKSEDVCKFDKNGQWKLEKSVAPHHHDYTIHHTDNGDNTHSYHVKDPSGKPAGRSHVQFDKHGSAMPHTSMNVGHEHHGGDISEAIQNHASAHNAGTKVASSMKVGAALKL